MPHFDPDLTLFPDRTFTDPNGVEYVPYIDRNNCVGYACVDTTGVRETEFLYFNPSSDDDGDPPESNVFVYHGSTGDPACDEPGNFYVVHERGE